MAPPADARVQPPRPGGGDLRDRVTVVVVQRERFSTTRRSLDSLLAHTPGEVPLLVVDAGSPARVRRLLQRRARARGFRVLRFPCLLSPMEARVLALEEVATPYVAFADNDVVFSPGWLEALVDCAEATGADLVAPLICIGEPVHRTVHVAGGSAEIRAEGGARRFREVQRFEGRPLAEVDASLVREPTGLVEFHCALGRCETLRRTGALDPQLLSTSEHLDASLAVRGAGGSIWFEPGARVTYLAPPPVAWADVPFYLLRWCDAWNFASERRFHAKWDVEFDDRVARFGRRHRRLALAAPRRAARALLGRRRAKRLFQRLEDRIIRRAVRARPAGLEPLPRLRDRSPPRDASPPPR